MIVLGEIMKRMDSSQFVARARSLRAHAIQTPLIRLLRTLSDDLTKRTTTQ